MNRAARTGVVGVGVLGASVGWHLTMLGAKVVFIDAGRPGAGVTNWSFSWVNASNKTVTRSYFDVNVAGMEAYRDLVRTIGPGSWWHPNGHLRWADSSAAEESLVDTAALLTKWGYRVEMRTGAEVRRSLEPSLVLPDDVAVAFYPDEGWVQGRTLVDVLLTRAVAAGAELVTNASVRDIETRGDGSVRAVALSDGTRIRVDGVVNAAGPAASTIASYVGRNLPMLHEPGAVARLGCEAVPVRRAMHAPRVEIRPDGPGSVVLHSREVDALVDTGEDEARLGQRLHDTACQVVPRLGNADVQQVKVVNRPIPADGFPSVGAVLSVPGYYEASSHSGITLGPVLGKLLAAEIITGERSQMLADFGPERFGL